MGYIQIALGIVAIGLGLYLYLKKCFMYWSDLGIPSEKVANVILGNLEGVGKTKHLSTMFDDIYYKNRSNAPIYGLYFTFKPTIMINDLDIIKAIMVKDFSNFEDRGVYFNEKDDPLSAHLFAIEGQKWRALRQTMSPTFTSGKMKYMFPTIMTVGERFQQKMIEVVRQDKEVEVKDWVARFTTDVIGICAFGLDCNCLQDPNAMFRKMGKKTIEQPEHSPLVFFLMDEFKETCRFFKMRFFSKDVCDFFTKVVNDTIEYREKSGVRKRDFMDLMLELRREGKTTKGLQALTNEELQAQAFVFYLAGFETSSTLLTFCFYELCINLDIQEKARQYIADKLKEHNNELTYEFFHDLKYIENVLNETLRKYPPVPFLIRHCKSDYKVSGTKYVIPKGINCIIPITSIQNDHQIYPNPQKFDPDRFTDEEIAKRHHFAHLPFGEGPRNCIGMRFGMLQAKIALVLMLKNFRFTLSPKTRSPLEIRKEIFIPSPIGGMHMIMEQI